MMTFLLTVESGPDLFSLFQCFLGCVEGTPRFSQSWWLLFVLHTIMLLPLCQEPFLCKKYSLLFLNDS